MLQLRHSFDYQQVGQNRSQYCGDNEEQTYIFLQEQLLSSWSGGKYALFPEKPTPKMVFTESTDLKNSSS